jgi:hypothetical protein
VAGHGVPRKWCCHLNERSTRSCFFRKKSAPFVKSILRILPTKAPSSFPLNDSFRHSLRSLNSEKPIHAFLLNEALIWKGESSSSSSSPLAHTVALCSALHPNHSFCRRFSYPVFLIRVHPWLKILIAAKAALRTLRTLCEFFITGHSTGNPSHTRPSREIPSLVYTPYFIKIPNKNGRFCQKNGLVYSFTYLYTKNVQRLVGGRAATMTGRRLGCRHGLVNSR